MHSLTIACQSIEQLKKDVQADDANLEKLQQFEKQIQTILKHLIHISITTKNIDANIISTLKQLYGFTLQSNINRNDFMSISKHVLQTLQNVQEALAVITVIKNSQ